MTKTTNDLKLSLIGVPTNSSGTTNGVALAPSVLRRAGLVDALSRYCDVHDDGDVDFLEPSVIRHNQYGIIVYDAFVSMIYSVKDAVKKALQENRLPIVIGGDCPILLGCLSAVKDMQQNLGLFFIDGHEDAYAPNQSPTGESADMELGLALGQNIKNLSPDIANLLPLVDEQNLCLFGPRDREYLQTTNVPSLGDKVRIYDDVSIQNKDLDTMIQSEISRLQSRVQSWWLHVDLDVLSTESFPAVDYRQTGGIGWDKLEQLTIPLLSHRLCVGWNVTIYNPDLDPNLQYAKQIIKYFENSVASIVS